MHQFLSVSRKLDAEPGIITKINTSCFCPDQGPIHSFWIGLSKAASQLLEHLRLSSFAYSCTSWLSNVMASCPYDWINNTAAVLDCPRKLSSPLHYKLSAKFEGSTISSATQSKRMSEAHSSEETSKYQIMKLPLRSFSGLCPQV